MLALLAAGSAAAQAITGGISGGVGGVSFANPTATVGSAVVAGSASTAMRSDAAPALAPGAAVANLGFNPPSIAGTPTSGDCIKWASATQLGDAGAACGTSGMVYPGSGIPTSTGAAWGSSYGVSGSGSVALTTSPVFTTPSLGAATATTINGDTLTSGTFVLTGSAGKTLTFNNSLTIAGADATTMTFPSTSGTVATLNTANTFTALQTFNNSIGFGSSRGLNLTGSDLLFDNVTATCSATGGSPTCAMTAQNGSAAQEMTLGAASSVTSLTITPGFTASHGFVCDAFDATTTTERLKQTATTTTTATLTFYNDAGTATSPGASDVIWSKCLAL